MTLVDARRETNALVDRSDSSLAATVRRGDEAAFAELYRRHCGSVQAAIRRVLGPSPTCEDIVAEVFLSLWLAPEKFDPERGTVLRYLCMKARAMSIDDLRSQSSRRRREIERMSERRTDRADIESELVAVEDAVSLRRAIAALPFEEREPIRLAYFVGMTYRSVAWHLCLPEGTVKSRIRSGLRRLRSSERVQLLKIARDAEVGCTTWRSDGRPF